MGLVGHNSRDRENNTTMSDSLASEYGISYAKSKTKHYASVKNHRSASKRFGKYVYSCDESFPYEYGSKLYEALSDALGAFPKDTRFTKKEKRVLAEHNEKILAVVKKAYNLDAVYSDDGDVDVLIKLIKDDRSKKEKVRILETIYTCRGEGMASMSAEEQQALSTYWEKMRQYNDDLKMLRKKMEFFQNAVQDIELNESSQTYATNEINATQKAIDEAETGINKLESYRNLIIRAIYGANPKSS